MGKTIMQLRMERKRLIKIAKKQMIEERKIREAQEEKRRLKKQVAALKKRTSRTILARTKKITKSIKSRATSPEVKRNLMGIRRELKRKFSKFQALADRFG